MGGDSSAAHGANKSVVAGLVCVIALVALVWLVSSIACAMQRHVETLLDRFYYAVLDESAPFAVADGIEGLLTHENRIIGDTTAGGQHEIGVAYECDPARFVVLAWSPFKDTGLFENPVLSHDYVKGSPDPATPCDHYATMVLAGSDGVTLRPSGKDVLEAELKSVSVCAYLHYFDDYTEAIVIRTNVSVGGQQTRYTFRRPIGTKVMEYSAHATSQQLGGPEDDILACHREAILVFLRAYARSVGVGEGLADSAVDEMTFVKADRYIGQ